MRETRKFIATVRAYNGHENDHKLSVTFCNSSASVTMGDNTIHLPWTELAAWFQWLAEHSEDQDQ